MSKIDWRATQEKDAEVYSLLVSRIDEHTAAGQLELAKVYQTTLDAFRKVYRERYGMDFWAIKSGASA